MSNMKTLAEIWERLREAETVTIVGHYNPDMDCISSTLALHLVLQKMGKKTIPVNADIRVKRLKLVPHIDDIMFSYDVEALPYEGVLVMVDAGDERRVGPISSRMHLYEESIFIDHHIFRSKGGTYTYVDEHASSTAEIIASLILAHAEEHMDSVIATLLYSGIATDTGFFCHRNTSASSLTMAGKMVEHGCNTEEVDTMINRILDITDYHALANVLEALRIEAGGRVAYTVHYIDDAGRSYKSYNINAIDYVLNLSGVVVGFVVREADDVWRVSIRSRGNYHVNDIAEKFGGGGHAKAAGCEFPKSSYPVAKVISELLDEILPRVNTV